MNKYELWNMAESETVPPKLEDPMHTKKNNYCLDFE